MLESPIQKQILDYLKLTGIFHWRQNNMGVRRKGKWTKSKNTTKGVADIIAVYPFGQIVGIEVKSTDGVQSPDQKKFQAGLELTGGVYLLVRSLDDVRSYFDAQIGAQR